MTSVRLGLRANAAQFSLLVGLNALVGAMVGLERSVLPLVGQHDFTRTKIVAHFLGPLPVKLERSALGRTVCSLI